jgi:hypothetical protein
MEFLTAHHILAPASGSAQIRMTRGRPPFRRHEKARSVTLKSSVERREIAVIRGPSLKSRNSTSALQTAFLNPVILMDEFTNFDGPFYEIAWFISRLTDELNVSLGQRRTRHQISRESHVSYCSSIFWVVLRDYDTDLRVLIRSLMPESVAALHDRDRFKKSSAFAGDN